MVKLRGEIKCLGQPYMLCKDFDHIWNVMKRHWKLCYKEEMCNLYFKNLTVRTIGRTNCRGNSGNREVVFVQKFR